MQTKDGREQISLRLPPETLERIDARRGPQGITRDEWFKRAAEYCLNLPVRDPQP